jgi:hypothetical protein
MEADVIMKITRVLPLLAIVLILGISLTGYPSSPSLTQTVQPANPPATAQPAEQPMPEPVKTQPSPQELKTLALDDQVKKSGHMNGQNNGMSCVICHISDTDTKLLNPSWNSCGACHVNSTKELQVGKEVLHPQFEMIQGLPISTIPRTPAYKYAYMKDTFSCTDCHITNSEKHDFLVPGVTITRNASGNTQLTSNIDYDQFKKVFRQAKCVVCHSDPDINVNSVKVKQQEIGKKLDQLRPVYLEWSKKVATLSADDPKVIAFKNGATFFTFVDNDGSKGAHNFNYSTLLLSKAESYWKALTQ